MNNDITPDDLMKYYPADKLIDLTKDELLIIARKFVELSKEYFPGTEKEIEEIINNEIKRKANLN